MYGADRWEESFVVLEWVGWVKSMYRAENGEGHFGVLVEKKKKCCCLGSGQM